MFRLQEGLKRGRKAGKSVGSTAQLTFLPGLKANTKLCLAWLIRTRLSASSRSLAATHAQIHLYLCISRLTLCLTHAPFFEFFIAFYAASFSESIGQFYAKAGKQIVTSPADQKKRKLNKKMG